MARSRAQRRDEFPQSVKDTLGRRVGYQCSRCYKSTLGPTTDPNRASNTGVAAHITAAAEGGPRFDSALTAEERRSATNGMWCCAICGKMIDDDTQRFTAPGLREMKAIAERAADQRRDIAESHNAAVIDAVALSRTAALAAIAQWRATYHVEQAQLVELDLMVSGNGSEAGPTRAVVQIAAGLKRNEKLVVRGRPGAGKTMTLLQTAHALAADHDAPVPFVLSISAWAASGRDLFAYVEDRLVANGVERATVPMIFRAGRIALLLNGWNETAGTDLVRAERLLKEFELNFPGTPLLLTTRATTSRPAFVGEVVLDVRPLSRTKKTQLVRAAGLANSDELMRQIVSRPALDRVTDTPLFLSAAIRIARSGTPLPETRSGLLRRCLDDLESADDHRAALAGAPCHGFHRAFLAEIAATMTRQGRTTLASTDAQTAVAACARRLREAGHLASDGSSTAILDCLVRHHVLVLSPSGDGSLSFSHQQFQERFAADSLMDVIRSTFASPLPPAVSSLQTEILNFPHWGEPLAFVVEDLVTGGSPEIAAAVVRWMMPLDLVAAAELAGVGGVALWPSVRDDLSPALRHWHGRTEEAHRECSLAAMIATASPDFADLIWPLLEGADDQDFFQPLRAYSVFNTSCLGPNWQERMVRLSARRQEVFLGEMSRQSGIPELDFARQVAVSDAPASVKNAAIEFLAERGLGSEAVTLAQAATFGPWTIDTYRLFDRIPFAVMAPLLPRLLQELERSTDRPIRQAIIGELKAHNHPTWLEHAKRELEAVARERGELPPVNNGERTGRRHELAGLMASYAELVGAVEPAWLETWLMQHEASGLLWEHPFVERVTGFTEDHLATLAEEEIRTPRNFGSSERVGLLAKTGSTRVADLFLQAFLGANAANKLDRRDLFREVPASAVAVPVLSALDRATTFPERVTLIEALELTPNLRSGLNATQQDRLRQLAHDVAAAIPPEYPHTPRLRALLADFLGRIGKPEDARAIEALAATETARWESIRRDVAEARRTHRHRQLTHDQTSYSNYYIRALVQLGGAESETILVHLLDQLDWLGEASRGLVQLCRREGLLPEEPSAMNRRPEISQVVPFNPGATVSRRAESIHTALTRHLAAGAAPQAIHRPDIVGAAGSLALLHDSRAIDLLLGANMERAGYSVIDHLHVMAQRGAILPGRRILAALEPFIKAGEDIPRGSGHDSWHTIVRGFTMILASDAPEAAIERMRRVPLSRLQEYYGRDLFAVLAACPKAQAGDFLVELSNTLPSDSRSYPDLIDALCARPDPACKARLLNLAATPRHSFPRNLAQVAEQDPGFGRALGEKLLALGERERALMVANLGDFESVPAMLAILTLPDLRPHAGVLHKMVRGVCLAKVPVGTADGGYFHLVPRAANTVRPVLAGLLLSTSPDNRAVAAALLSEIQRHRLQYGHPPDEPLHPDANLLPRLKGPWPLIS